MRHLTGAYELGADANGTALKGVSDSNGVLSRLMQGIMGREEQNSGCRESCSAGLVDLALVWRVGVVI